MIPLDAQVQEGFIFLTEEDRLRISKFTSKPIIEFAKFRKFDGTRFSGKGWFWSLKNAAGTHHCRFLIGGKCSIYEVRPAQCRTFPFWPEIVSQPQAIQEIAKQCPGIGKGEELTQIETEARVAEQVRADEKYSTQNG